MSYRRDRSWADRCMPWVLMALGEALFSTASMVEDVEEGTDLRIVNMPDRGRVAVRVRRPGYADRYPGEVTIRSRRSNGTKTELGKMLGGQCLAHWYFYGHAAPGNRLASFVVFDLVGACSMIGQGRITLGRELSNGDGTFFRTIKTRELLDLGLVKHEFKWSHGTARGSGFRTVQLSLFNGQ